MADWALLRTPYDVLREPRAGRENAGMHRVRVGVAASRRGGAAARLPRTATSAYRLTPPFSQVGKRRPRPTLEDGH